jgi:hypothetical protein
VNAVFPLDWQITMSVVLTGAVDPVVYTNVQRYHPPPALTHETEFIVPDSGVVAVADPDPLNVNTEYTFPLDPALGLDSLSPMN